MKTHFIQSLHRIALSLTLTVTLASCTKDEARPTPDTGGHKGGSVAITLVADQPQGKAFFDGTAEAWEKTLGTLSIFVFDPAGTLLTQRNFTPDELAAKKAVFSIPGATPGANCEFYAVANIPVTNITDKAGLLALLESSPADYNGTFAEVSTKAKRAGGFVMSGSASKAIAAAGTQTDVAVTLKRTVAKIAVQAGMSADFSSKYRGAVKINSIKLSKAASQSPVIKPAAPTPGGMTYTHTQSSNTAGAKYQNLFYVFENGALAAGSRVLLELDATYDADGNFSSTKDQASVSYKIELDGKAGGLIERNGYYKIDASISGLSGSDAAITVSVAEWESPVTQTLNVGQ